MPSTKGSKTLGPNKSAVASKRDQNRRENYDSLWDKVTRPEWFDEENNRTQAHPKFGKPRDPKSSLKKYAKGGSASSRGDGIAKKGKTKGKMR